MYVENTCATSYETVIILKYKYKENSKIRKIQFRLWLMKHNSKMNPVSSAQLAQRLMNVGGNRLESKYCRLFSSDSLGCACLVLLLQLKSSHIICE